MIKNGDSAYNKRHGKGHCKGKIVPFGALVDIMPQPDHKRDVFDNKTIKALFLGYHEHPGGVWSGDYHNKAKFSGV